MSDYIEKGTVKEIREIEEFASGFKKRKIVITTEGKYPKDFPFDFFKEKINLLDNLAVGQEVAIRFNIQSNEYNGKYYVTLAGWKVDAGSIAVAEEDEIPF